MIATLITANSNYCRLRGEKRRWERDEGRNRIQETDRITRIWCYESCCYTRFLSVEEMKDSLMNLPAKNWFSLFSSWRPSSMGTLNSCWDQQKEERMIRKRRKDGNTGKRNPTNDSWEEIIEWKDSRRNLVISTDKILCHSLTISLSLSLLFDFAVHAIVMLCLSLESQQKFLFSLLSSFIFVLADLCSDRWSSSNPFFSFFILCIIFSFVGEMVIIIVAWLLPLFLLIFHISSQKFLCFWFFLFSSLEKKRRISKEKTDSSRTRLRIVIIVLKVNEPKKKLRSSRGFPTISSWCRWW